MRLIDAGALEFTLSDRAKKLDGYYGSLGGAANGALQLLLTQPTVDAAPTTHGHWTKKYDDFSQDYNSDNNWEYVCSECGRWTKSNSSYCPNCGAKMDAE